jgi:hypothetical protein
MRLLAARILSPLLLVISILLLPIHWIGTAIAVASRLMAKAVRKISQVFELAARVGYALGRAPGRISSEIRGYRSDARTMSRDLAAFTRQQQAENPLDPDKQTVFLLITCGQAVRNFLLSDVLDLLRSRFNVVILSTYAYSENFRTKYGAPGVHVLPWFESFRTLMERMFQYYFMSKSRSRTHHSWLANLEHRARNDKARRKQFLRLIFMRRVSDLLGGLIGARGMQGLYGSFFLSYVPRSLVDRLLAAYRPALVISTTAHHAEAWPLTYFSRRAGVKTLANILSWDNTTTKAIMDTSCDYYTVWSREMTEEFSYQFPHIKTKVVITGCPMFDMYSNKRYAKSRELFLAELGLPADKPYILYTTNTPAAMPDECEIVRQYWQALNSSRFGGKVNLVVRLHPKESIERYRSLVGVPGVAVTLAAEPHWNQSDRWLPDHRDMGFLLNSMLHAAVSVNVASTMSLESFALGLPTINVAFKSSKDLKDHGSMWSFDMYHYSEHYHALVDNGAVELVHSVDELVTATIDALENGSRRKDAMQRTLEQKAAYSDGTSAERFLEVVSGILQARSQQPERPARPVPFMPARYPAAEAAE